MELQLYFIRKRDETCKNGEVLVTPALSLTERRFHITVEQVRTRAPTTSQSVASDVCALVLNESPLLDTTCV